MKPRKGEPFEIDVDAYVVDKVDYFRDRIPDIAASAAATAEPLRGKTFRVERTQSNGEVIIYWNGTGFTGIKSEFCKRIQ